VSRLLTIGTFDIPHAGHAAFLRHCEAFADEVLVGINSDTFVARYKGAPPVFDWYERCDLIAELGYVCHENNGPGRDLIERIRPDVIAIGTDWARKDYYAQIDTPPDYFDANGITLVYIPYTTGISTTILKERLRG